jgi:hypothetical protein
MQWVPWQRRRGRQVKASPYPCRSALSAEDLDLRFEPVAAG